MKKRDIIDKIGSLSAILFFAIQLLRAKQSSYSDEFKFILGISPNIVGVLFLMTLLRRYLRSFFKTKVSVRIFNVLIYFIAIAALMLWEFLRLIIGKNPMDTNDIIASIITGLAFLLFMQWFDSSEKKSRQDNSN